MTANRLYFAQHGLAVDKAEDSERPLSVTGIAQTETVAETLRSSNAPITCIYHSGKLRAAQTAEIIARTLNIPAISATDGLSPNDDAVSIAQNLNADNALYIGHLPHMEKLVSYLVSGNENTDILKFQNSAVVCLEKNENSYHILWYITPV